jgi:hypothetical protein
MVDRALGEAPAHGQPAVAAADDDGGDVARRHVSIRTEVVELS